MNVLNAFGYALATFAIVVSVTGCNSDPDDMSLLKKGCKLEISGKFSEAAAVYAESAALGNAEAYKKLGDLVISHDFVSLSPENTQDFITGHDKWLASAKQLVSRAKDLYDKAQVAGYTNQLQIALDRLAKCETQISTVENKVAEAKKEERIRQEELRKEREEAARKAREEAARMAEEERIRREEAAAQAKKRAEEEARRNSPEYCIDNDIELTPAALREVIREITFISKTGNDIYDKQEMARHHERFMNKIITVSGRINKVQVTAFTREVKCIVGVNGGTISARFDGMSRDEAAQFRVGQPITLRGQISNRPVTSTFAMDRCMLR